MSECRRMIEDKFTCIDEHHSDQVGRVLRKEQLLIFMALGRKRSSLVVRKRSLHLETMVWLLKEFMPSLEIRLQELEEGGEKYNRVEVIPNLISD